MARVFLSHSSRDNSAAAELKAWLDGQGFAPAFLDFDKHSGIAAGADWERTLYEQIQRCQALVILQSPNWSASRWCFAEFTQARALGKPIFQVVESDEGAAEAPIAADLQRLDLRHDRPAGLESLRRELERIALQDQNGFPWPPLNERSLSPYPGMVEFQEDHAAVFFGRDDAWRTVIERLNIRRVQGGPRLLVVQGSSGAGKSSLLRAGVLPRLRRAGRQWLLMTPMRPQTNPLEAMVKSWALALGRGGEFRVLHQELRQAARSDSSAALLKCWAEDLQMAAATPDAQILLSIDQGEELFTQAEAEEKQGFLTVLGAALSQPMPFQAVMTIRADAMGELQQVPALVNRFETLPLGPLSLERYREIIEGPARVGGLSVEPAFVERAIQDTATEDALPLLAFALRQLHDRYGADGVLSLIDYQALGDPASGLSPLENAVKQAADGVLQIQRPDEASLKALREAFVPAMVRVSEQGSYARRAAAWGALPKAAWPLLEALVDARLLVRRQGEGQPSTVEVAHEALLRVWPLLRGWLDESREFLLGSQQLEQDLVQWQDASHADKPQALLSGLKLARARAWLAEHGEQLSPEMRDFIRGSDASEKSRLAQLKLQKAAVSSLRQFESGRELEGLLAGISNGKELKSLDRDSNFATYSPVFALQQMLYKIDDDNQFREKNRLEHSGLVYCIGFTPDRKLIVTGGERGIGHLWSSSGRMICDLQGHVKDIRSIGISPHEPLIATASIDGTVMLWDYTGKKLLELSCHEKAISSVSFSPHEPLFATSSEDGTVRLWDYAGRDISIFRCHQKPIKSMCFSPHELLFATASEDGTAKLWNYSGEEVNDLPGHKAEVNSVSFSSAERLVITTSQDGLARVWRDSGELLQELPGHRAGVIGAVFSPDGQLVATASEDGLVRLWNRSWQILQEFRGHVDSPYCVTFSPDGDILAACWEIRAILFKRSRVVIQKFPDPPQGVTQISYSRDGEIVAVALKDGTVELFNSAGDPIRKLSGHGWVMSISYSIGARRIAIVSQNGAVSLRSYAGDLVGEFFADGSPIWGADISPNGEIIATACDDGKIRLWNRFGKCMDALSLGDNTPLSSVRFSPNGQEIAAISWYGTASYWQLPGSLVRTFNASTHGRRCLDIRFSPDGKLIATASEDGTARLWACTLDNDEPLQELRGHQGWVNRVEFSPVGGLIATAASDGVIRIWSNTGELVHEFHTFQIRPNSLSFTSDGKAIAIASHYRSASCWTVYDLDDLLDMGNCWLQDYLNTD